MSISLRRLMPFLLALLPAAAWPQSMDAEWRVLNEVASPTVVPTYQGQANPFPITPLPQTVKVEQQPEEELSEAERTKAETLASARQLINSNAVFRPSLEGIVFDGYMKGAQGERVFSEGQWHGLGSEFHVPVRGAQQAYNIIENLRNLDAALADQVTSELNARLSASKDLILKITNISNKEVTLSGQSQTFKVPVRHGGF